MASEYSNSITALYATKMFVLLSKNLNSGGRSMSDGEKRAFADLRTLVREADADLTQNDGAYFRHKLAAIRSEAVRYQETIGQSMCSFVVSIIDNITDALDMKHEWVPVIFYLPNKAVADAFIGYMSDGGGEYGFFETDEGRRASFEYFDRDVFVTISPEDD